MLYEAPVSTFIPVRYQLFLWTGTEWDCPYYSGDFANVLSDARQYQGWRIYDYWQECFIAEQMPNQREGIHKIGEAKS